MAREDQHNNQESEKAFQLVQQSQQIDLILPETNQQDPHPDRAVREQGLPNRSYQSVLLVLALAILLVCAVAYQSSSSPTFVYGQQEVNVNPFKLIKALKGEHKLISTHSNHPNLTFKFPTVGLPTPGKSFNSTRVDKQHLPQFDDAVNEIFKPYNDTDCEFTRIGAQIDGGYVLCKNYLAQTEALFNFGIDNNDRFGCSLTEELLIPNYQYDCTVSNTPSCSNNNSLDVFSKVCVGEISESTPDYMFYTFWDILKSRGMVKKHIVLKLDTEGGEYFFFKYFPTELLDHVDQIIAEFHFDILGPQRWGNLDILQTLGDKFVAVNYHMNNHGCFKYFNLQQSRHLPSHAFEVTLVNKKLINRKSNSRSFKEHSLNSPNTIHSDDCQMPQ